MTSNVYTTCYKSSEQYEKIYVSWRELVKTDNKYLSQNAVRLLSILSNSIRRGILYTNYTFLTKKFNRSSKQIKRYFVELESANIAKFTFRRSIVFDNKKLINVILISITDKTLNLLHFKTQKHSSLSGHNCPLKESIHNDINNKKNRSIESAFDKADSESNFCKKGTSKKAKFLPRSKLLHNFYPLSQKECIYLQKESGREFNLNTMNEILKSMALRLSDRIFKSKKAFLSYMTKALRYEIREAVQVNNETFYIKANRSSKEQDIKQREEFLSAIENSTGTSPEMHLKKKLAGVLAPNKAYRLLQAYSTMSIENNIVKIYLHKPVELTKLDQSTILTQIKATRQIKSVKSLEIITVKPEINAKKHSYSSTTGSKLSGIWGMIRTSLMENYGPVIDNALFDKLEATVNDQNRSIELKAPSRFIKDLIERSYRQAISILCKQHNYTLNWYG